MTVEWDIIYVVGFAPSFGSPNGVGGYDWFRARPDAVAALHDHLLDEGLNYTLCEVPVPKNASADIITRLLDDMHAWFEVSVPIEDDLGNEYFMGDQTL